MEVEQLAMPKKKAAEEFDALKQVFKQHNTFRSQDQIYRDMQKVYGHLQHGKKIIDIYEAFKKTGLNEESDPKLAICRADRTKVIFEKHLPDRGDFRYYIKSNHFGYRSTPRIEESYRSDYVVPSGIFPEWKDDDGKKLLYDSHIHNRTIETIVPIIPAHILIDEVRYLLPNYYILWEVEKWQPIPPKDPILLKKLTPNLFGVLATWNLTELERAIIRGRIS